MTLREDATFHDGEPLDADDVAFSVEFFRDNVFPLLTSYAEPFVEVNVVDATTIELTTEDEMSGGRSSTANLYAIYVLPEHIWARRGPAGVRERGDGRLRAVHPRRGAAG